MGYCFHSYVKLPEGITYIVDNKHGEWIPLDDVDNFVIEHVNVPLSVTKVHSYVQQQCSAAYVLFMMSSIHRYKHQPSSTIINHHQPSSTIINHHQPSSTIINHHQPSTIINHQPSSTINHHQPSSTINHHQPSTPCTPLNFNTEAIFGAENVFFPGLNVLLRDRRICILSNADLIIIVYLNIWYSNRWIIHG